MSYQGLRDEPQQGYGQYNPYGHEGNPYTSGAYDVQPQSHGSRPGVQQQSSSRYDEEQAQGGYEMGAVNGNDPNRILNECRAVDQAIDGIENDLQRLRGLQQSFLRSPDASSNSSLGKEVDALGDDIMRSYRGLVNRVKSLKQNPESGNPRNSAQVGKVDRRLKTAINQYQQLDRDYRQENQAQIERQYRIVRPDASDAEVREAVESSQNQQVFSSALISSDRRGEAQTALRAVNNRHAAIQKIERDMEQLAQLFQDLDTLVVQQEAAVTQIEQRGEEVTDHVQKANTELDGAVKKARAARRKKWWCLGIVILILIIIAVVVAVAVTVTKK